MHPFYVKVSFDYDSRPKPAAHLFPRCHFSRKEINGLNKGTGRLILVNRLSLVYQRALISLVQTSMCNWIGGEGTLVI